MKGADAEGVLVDAVSQLAWETEERGIDVVAGGACLVSVRVCG